MTTTFELIEARYNATKPYRGWSTDVRPWGNRRKQNERIIKYGNDTYAARLYDTDVVVVRRDGTVTIDISHASRLTNRFLDTVTSDLKLFVRGAAQFGRPWLIVGAFYPPLEVHPASDEPVTFLPNHEVDMTGRRYVRQVPCRVTRKPVLDGARILRNVLTPLCKLNGGKFTGRLLVDLYETDVAGLCGKTARGVLEHVTEHHTEMASEQLLACAVRIMASAPKSRANATFWWAQSPDTIHTVDPRSISATVTTLFEQGSEFWMDEPIEGRIPCPHNRIHVRFD